MDRTLGHPGDRVSESGAHPLGFEPPIPHLISGADEEELTINLGLGLVARKAAEAEYILHGIYVHLVEAEKAYTDLASPPAARSYSNAERSWERSPFPLRVRRHSPKPWTLRRKDSVYGTATCTGTGSTTTSPASGSP